TVRLIEHCVDGVEMVGARDEVVVAGFVPYVERNQDGHREADGEATDVEGGVELVAAQVAQRGGEVVAKHGGPRCPWLGVILSGHRPIGKRREISRLVPLRGLLGWSGCSEMDAAGCARMRVSGAGIRADD